MNIILSTHPLLKCINIRIHTTKTVYSGTPLFLLCSTFCVKTWGRYSMKQTIPQETGSESVILITTIATTFHNIHDRQTLDAYYWNAVGKEYQF